ncbi:MAG: hypothetical protein WC846_01890 [Candidatus Gracilibacteria bacterium]|jgi:hypothetical protein
MQKICTITKKPFEVSEREVEILARLGFDPPTICPEERHKRRLAHRNEHKIYKGTCALTGKPIITIFSPDKSIKSYSQEAWWGDDWDPRDSGRNFDFSRPFFDQFHELELDAAHMSLMNTQAENSEFCNITTNNKNCYLVFGGDFCEDCMYTNFSMNCRDTFDVYWVNRSELTYECVDAELGYNLLYSRNSVSCSDSAFLFGCRNCKNCMFCVGLIGKEYYIWNKPCTREEYEKQVKDFNLGSRTAVQNLREEFEKFRLKFPHRYANIINSENCTGDIISGAKNCQNCFCINENGEDLKDVFLTGWSAKDCYSCDHVGHKAEMFYECMGSIGATICAFSTYTWHTPSSYYCNMVANSHDLFGCTNMRRNEYCILNKQYSKDDYAAMRARIIEHMKKTGEWGEFFPAKNSLFAYNETVANDYYPLTRAEALSRGLKWFDEEVRSTENAPSIPDNIADTTDEILNQTLICQKTGRPYRILPKELAFYRRQGIPVPIYAPETRIEMRLKFKKQPVSYSRTCSKCGAAILTSYSPLQPEVVYCNECYLKTVY